MPPATVSLVLLAHAYIIRDLWAFVGGQRPDVGFLVKLRVKFVFIRSIRLNTILLLVHLVLAADELTILKISSLNSVELLRLKLAGYFALLIASIQKLLVNLRLIFVALAA